MIMKILNDSHVLVQDSQDENKIILTMEELHTAIDRVIQYPNIAQIDPVVLDHAFQKIHLLGNEGFNFIGLLTKNEYAQGVIRFLEWGA